MQEGELFGIANLLSARKTSQILQREKATQKKYEIKLLEIEGGLDGGGNAGSAVGGGGGDDDEAWQIAAREMISDEADEGVGDATAGKSAGDRDGDGEEGRFKGGGKPTISVQTLLKKFMVHEHTDIVVRVYVCFFCAYACGGVRACVRACVRA